MTSLESTTSMVLSSSVLMQEEKEDQEADKHYSLSRLSVCTRSTTYTSKVLRDFNDDDDHTMQLCFSNLSLESLGSKEVLQPPDFGPSSDSDNDPFRHSLFATIHPHKMRCNLEKDYQHGGAIKRKSLINKRGGERERCMEQSNGFSGKNEGNHDSFRGGRYGGDGGGGIVVIIRPKGGRRSLCMDFEEVKACRDLGFELEHEWMLEVLSSGRRGGGGGCGVSGSNVGTNCGGNSAIANWRISNPGDDPQEVKARLKLWAQAVALACSFCHNGHI